VADVEFTWSGGGWACRCGKNAEQKYRVEAFELFWQLLDVVKMEVTRVQMTVCIQSQEAVPNAAVASEGPQSNSLREPVRMSVKVSDLASPYLV
jgi:preprotein translocase subunit SecA